MADAEDGEDFSLFEEPRDFFKPEAQPTFVSHTLLSGKKLTLRLVGHNPLWGHFLWNAGRTIADYLEENASEYVKGRNILELGAGAGLPSLICALNGANRVIVTDYPDPELIENLKTNIEQCSAFTNPGILETTGHLWGDSVDSLLALLPPNNKPTGFQTLILADLLFNHSEHVKLLHSIEHTLQHSSDACALVFFTPYRPWLLEKDLAFFELAKQAGFMVEKIFEKLMEKVMFKEDPGDEKLRRTVYGYRLRRAGTSE
ncbi:uncharacterized protein PV09_05385 [Verruconis gallopava]|uniref:Protein N-terminal and lysine N-methyltransferase EFM7 n=1 Tax=Verruconis gallopava TaxID=253628 RepID=A0A0D2AA56_9PEZI|nr:uncharacterized protein PV09_05385 [Verruconis gallopava]KIW03633.1 hypothetical protein PV09_05385 [Verruconis gallopava]